MFNNINKIHHGLIACGFTLCLAAATPPAYAVDELGLFELDRNAIDSPAGLPDDWENVSHKVIGVPIGGSDDHAVARVFIDRTKEDDQPFGSETVAPDTSYFNTGGSKDVNDLDEWRHDTGDVAPAKDEIVDAFAAGYIDPISEDLIIYFGLDRKETNGNAFVGFWFLHDLLTDNQDPEKFGDPTPGNEPKHFVGIHTGGPDDVVGDLLVLSDFTGGGEVPEIKVYEWVGDNNGDVDTIVRPPLGGGSGPLQLIFASASAECEITGAPGAQPACALSNTSPTPSPWVYLVKTKGKYADGDIQTGALFEGGINVNALFQTDDATCFSSFLAETRSSQSEDAQLKDYALGTFSLCDFNITKTPSTDEVCENLGGSVTYNYVINNTGSAALEGVTVVDDMGTPGDPSDDIDVVDGDLVSAGDLGTITVPAGGSVPLSYLATLAPSEDPIINTVTATADFGNGQIEERTAMAEVTVATCDIDLSKTPNVTNTCDLDGAVTYSYTITNPGTVDLENVTLVDNNGTADPSDDWDVIDNEPASALPLGSIASIAANGGSSGPWTFSTTISENTTNTATAVATALGETIQAEAMASVVVDTCQYTVNKGCSTNGSGEAATIDYTITVTNTGTAALTNVNISDPTTGVNSTVSLASGASEIIPGNYTPVDSDLDGFPDESQTNTVTVSGATAFAGTDAELVLGNQSDFSTCIIPTQPGILADKTCSNGSFENGDINYYVEIANDGNVTLENVTVNNSINGAADVELISGVTLAPKGQAGDTLRVPVSGTFSYPPEFTWNYDTITVTATDAITDLALTPIYDSAICRGCPFVDNPGLDGDTGGDPGSPGTIN